METKIPTLKELKAYFKNAKEVRCLRDNKIYNIEVIKRDFHFFYDNIWINTPEMSILIFDNTNNKYAEIISYKEEPIDVGSCINDFKTPKHYDNSKGSIYQFCENQNLNSYEFDIIKRVVRSRKKGNFKEDLEKTKHLIDLYLKEYEK